MSLIAIEALVFVVSLLAGMAGGYGGIRVQKRLEKVGMGQLQEKIRMLFAPFPFFLAFIAGSVILGIASPVVANGDKFYSAREAMRVAVGCAFGTVAVLLLPMMMGWATARYAGAATSAEGAAARAARTVRTWKWPIVAVSQIAAAIIAVMAGIRFSVLSVLPEHTVELGTWAPVLTVIWILLATNAVALLDGIEGAADLLLLIAAVAVLFVTLGTNERFLNALCVAIVAATLASLRFNLYPARLPLKGFTSVPGFVFAVLTVLARQKTQAALAIVLPLVVACVVAGGFMLGFLERTMSLGPDDDEADDARGAGQAGGRSQRD